MILIKLILVLGICNIWWKILSHWHMAGHTFLHNFHNFYQFIPVIRKKTQGSNNYDLQYSYIFLPLVLSTLATNTTAKTDKSSRYLLVPVCQGHHDVQRCKKEHCVKEGIVVRHAFRLIIIYFLAILQIRVGIWTHTTAAYYTQHLSADKSHAHSKKGSVSSFLTAHQYTALLRWRRRQIVNNKRLSCHTK